MKIECETDQKLALICACEELRLSALLLYHSSHVFC